MCQNKPKVCVLAPGHDEYDNRVLRSIFVFRKFFNHVDAFYESERALNEVQCYERISINEVIYHSVRKKKIKRISFVDDYSYLLLHDSGLYGLFFLKYLERSHPELKVIFDYHDFVIWEFLYHLKKIKLSNLIPGKLKARVFKIFAKLFLSQNDVVGLVGISKAQVLSLISIGFFKVRNNNYAIVPNTREKLSFPGRELENRVSLVWVGNVGLGRQFEKMYDVLDFITSDGGFKANVSVIGKVYGGLELDASVENLGSFENDADVFSKLEKRKAIGLFFGWDDPHLTGINEIASPNKVYTYINVEIPFLVPASLGDLITQAKLPPCFLYIDEDDLNSKVKDIMGDYEYYVDKVREIKSQDIWDDYGNRQLNVLIEKLAE